MLTDIVVIAVVAGFAGCVIWLFARRNFKYSTIYDHQAGLHFYKGKFVRVLPTGRHRFWGPQHAVEVRDLRASLLTLYGQELLTKDTLTVKVSAVIQYKIADTYKEFTVATRPLDLLNAAAQTALRHAIAPRTLDEVLNARGEIGAEIIKFLAPEAEKLGYTILSAEIRDLMLSGELKRAFSEAAVAKKQGEAALERARGETAAMRSLANAARMMNDNPGLMNLRLIQLLGSGAAKGSTVVLNASGGQLGAIPLASETATSETSTEAN